jgi:hypothetical protein
MVVRQRRAMLVAVKALHTVVCLAMSAAVLYVLVSGITGTGGPLVWVAIGIVLLEAAAYAAGRMQCPLTRLARSLGDPTGNDYLSDLLVPQRWIRHIVPSCGLLFAVGLLLLGAATLLGAGAAR